MSHKLTDGRQVTADHADACGHGLHQHHGDPIAIASRINSARKNEQICVGTTLLDFRVSPRAQQGDRLLYPKLVDKRMKLGLLWATPDDLALEALPTSKELRHGMNENVEALLWHQASDR